MNITTSQASRSARHTKANLSSVTLSDEKKGGDSPKPSAVDTFSAGAAKWGGRANFAMGAWTGGVAGVAGGAAIGLGKEAIGAVIGAINGTASFDFSSLLSTVATTGVYAAVGGVAGAGLGGAVTYGVGKTMGNIGGKTAKKFGGNENVGRAIGTVGTGVALGTVLGASVAGWNGAGVALGAAAVGGGLAFINS